MTLCGGTTDQQSLIASHTVSYNTEFNLPNITPTKLGYVFKGWSIYPNGIGQEDTATETAKIVDVVADTVDISAIWVPTWIDNSVKDEVNKTITYTIDSNDKLEQLSNYVWQIGGDREYRHIFNISGDLQLNNYLELSENTTVNILGTLNINNRIELKGATLSLLKTQTIGLNISGFGGINVNSNANLIINGRSFIGNEVDSCIDVATNGEILITACTVSGFDEENQPFTNYGMSIQLYRGEVTIKNTNIENTNTFNITSIDEIRIEPEGKLIVDYNMTVEGRLNIYGELVINENKTVTLINDSILEKNENSVTGLGTLIDNRTVYITYNLKGGDLDLSRYPYNAPKHENFTLPIAPTMAGFGFVGWRVTDGIASEQYNAGEVINFDIISTNQVEIEAMWGRRT